MAGLQTSRYTCAGIPACVKHVLPVMVLRVVQQRLDPRLGETPRARVQRLFLRPNDVLGVGIHVQVLLQLGPRERIQLLDPCDRGVLDLLVDAVLVQRGIDLPGAEDDTFNVFGRVDLGAVFRVRDDPLEMGVAGEVLDGRASDGVAKKGFREEKDQWLPELSVHLSAKDVEEVGGRRHVCYLHVAVLMLSVELFRRGEFARVFVAELQVSFHAS